MAGIINRMPLHELHSFIESEIAGVPNQRGVYVLYQVQSPLHADGSENLRQALTAARTQFRGATHFSTETCETSARMRERLRQLREELRLVRTLAFVPRPV